MPKFFIKKDDIVNNSVEIRGDTLNHIKNVFRLKIGDVLTLCDGEGTDYKATIEEENSEFIRAKILEMYETNSEPSVNITLYQGIPKATKMDLIIQKNVELGIKRIVPVICERTIVKFYSKKDEEKKVERWQKISQEASKQSGRGIIPVIEEPIKLKDALNRCSNYDLAIIPYEKEYERTLKNVLCENNGAKEICMFIGPEGGFSEQEIEYAIQNNVIPVTLGNRILRTETASLYTTAIIIYELD